MARCEHPRAIFCESPNGLAARRHVQCGPGERADAQLKSWVLRKIRCCPTRAATSVNAVQALILAG
jgi:hypothetical protein